MATLFNILALILGVALFFREVRLSRQPQPHAHAFLLVGLAGGVLGARLIQGLASGLSGLDLARSLVDVSRGGRSLAGGLLGGWLGVAWAKRRAGVRGDTGDLWAVPLAGAEILGRFGCLFAGCCYGKVCDYSWAMTSHGALRHPTQIYSAAAAGLILIALELLRKRSSIAGQRFAAYLILWSGARFAIEFFREQEAIRSQLSAMQWLCIALFLYGVWKWRNLQQATILGSA